MLNYHRERSGKQPVDKCEHNSGRLMFATPQCTLRALESSISQELDVSGTFTENFTWICRNHNKDMTSKRLHHHSPQIYYHTSWTPISKYLMWILYSRVKDPAAEWENGREHRQGLSSFYSWHLPQKLHPQRLYHSWMTHFTHLTNSVIASQC